MLETKCVRCGKNFIAAPLHIYKDDKGLYCSWTCYNHRRDVAKQPRKKFKPVEQYSSDGKKLIRIYASAIDAVEYTGFTLNCIREACRSGKPYNGYMWKYQIN